MMKLKCNFDYCIYNKKDSCILEEIWINGVGMCDCCIAASIPKEKLEEYKSNQLQEIESRI